MENTELRIGNLVQGRKEQICRVYKLDKEEEDQEDDIRATPINGNATTRLPFQPIPLTEEWLLKLGFRKSAMYYDVDKLVLVKFTDNLFHVEFIPNVVIQSVHQLQNLYFALTGEELEIEDS